MSGGLEHGRYAESLAAYILGALPDQESAQMQRHLSSCPECQTEFERLRVAADALPVSVPSVEPPPELKVRVMEIVQAEAELLRAAGAAADQPPAPRRRTLRWPRLTGWVPRPVAALALTAAVAAVAVVLATGGGPASHTFRAQLSGPGRLHSRSRARTPPSCASAA